MKNPHTLSRGRPVAVHNRVKALTIHIPWYSVRTVSRLARDAKVAKSAVSRLLRGEGNPSYPVLRKISKALSEQAGFPIPIDEFAVPMDESFATEFPCDLFGCTCLPDWAYAEDGSRKPAWRDALSGKWTSLS